MPHQPAQRTHWFDAVQHGLDARYPNVVVKLVDGNEFTHGFSENSADRAFRDGWSAERYLAAVAEKRKLIRKYA